MCVKNGRVCMYDITPEAGSVAGALAAAASVDGCGGFISGGGFGTGRRFIDIPASVRKEIRGVFGCSEMAMWRALKYESSTGLSRRIRRLALLKGGRLMAELPLMETLHDADGIMRQELENGVQVVVWKETGLVRVFDAAGCLLLEEQDCSIRGLMAVQVWAAGVECSGKTDCRISKEEGI